MSGEILNIAGYRFIDLPDRDELRESFLEFCTNLELRGTVLLSPNGINFFLAGPENRVSDFIDFLESDVRFTWHSNKVQLHRLPAFQENAGEEKEEIISLGLEEIKPSIFTGPHIKPSDFKQLLDERQDILVLDTRNDYEVRIGSFEGAIDLGISSFREFPAAVNSLPDEYKSKQVVMYCTGGIRCRKPLQ